MICKECRDVYEELKGKPYYTMWFKGHKNIMESIVMQCHGNNWYCNNCGRVVASNKISFKMMKEGVI